MSSTKRLITALVFAASVALAACSSGGSSPASSTSATTSTPATATPAPTTFTISGKIESAPNTTLSLVGTSTVTAPTDANGNYSFTGVSAGSYTLAPTLTGYVFNPVSLATVVTSASITDVGFTGAANAAATFTLSGTVSGAASAGVIMTVNGVNVGSVATDASGNYSFSGLTAGTYTIAASLDGFTFSTAEIVTIGTADSTGNNFTATAATATNLALAPLDPLPQATVGTAYSNTVVNTISGGTAPYTYQTDTLDAGSPPLGMILNPNGKLTGTAKVAGTYAFNVCATDSAGNATNPCPATSITVAAAAGAPPAPVAPTVTLAASPSTIASGASTTLTWSTKNATSCTATGGWTGSKTTSGTLAEKPTATTTYTLVCTGTGGSATASAKVTVTAAVAPTAPTVTLTASPTSITSGSASTLTWSSKNATGCSAGGAWSGNENVSGSLSESPTTTSTYTMTCTGSGGSATASATVTVTAAVVTPPVAPTPPASGASWVYYNGAFDWPGDYSFGVVPDYNDTSGGPLSGTKDIKVTVTGSFGGWLPYAQNYDFNSAPYTKLTFALKPTVANQSWNVYFVRTGDIPVGIYLDVTKYGPAPVVGVWGTYTVPLADLGVQGEAIYKFSIHDETGLGSNVWYVDNVGFLP